MNADRPMTDAIAASIARLHLLVLLAASRRARIVIGSREWVGS